jgi:FkbM family methyltransferase
VKSGSRLTRVRDDLYRWVRTKTPQGLRSSVRRIPYVERIADASRPKGEQLLPVILQPNIVRKVSLPEAFHWISFEGYREPELLAWVSSHVPRGAVCLDVGGHLGIYALLMAEVAGPTGKALVFEPFPANADRIRRTVSANGLGDRVVLVEAAVDEADGAEVELFVGEADTYDRVSVYIDASRPDALRVPTVSIDAAVRRVGVDRVDLIKMDIEGAEDRAFRGAEDTVRRFHPPVLLEVHGLPGWEALTWLKSHGYLIAAPDGVAPNQARHIVATHGGTS